MPDRRCKLGQPDGAGSEDRYRAGDLSAVDVLYMPVTHQGKPKMVNIDQGASSPRRSSCRSSTIRGVASA